LEERSLKSESKHDQRIQDFLVIAAAALAASVASGAADAKEQTIVAVVKNVTTDKTLRLPDGKMTKAPIAPGVYAVVRNGFTLFDTGKPAGKSGLEALAEDGNAEMLIRSLKGQKDVRDAGMFIPGQSFEVSAEPGDRFVFPSMFVQSNDKFYAPDPNGITLFDSMSAPVSGDWTKSIKLWDAGTEKDETPGLGSNQAPRQPAANTGPAEEGPIHAASDGFQYPPVSEVIQLTLQAK
jgi:hypothetical protein